MGHFFLIVFIGVIVFIVRMAIRSARESERVENFQPTEWRRMRIEDRALRHPGSPAEPTPPTDRPPGRPGGKRVLVLDDSRTVQQAVFLVLGPEGYDVLAASDEGEARKQVGALPPDLILVEEDFGTSGGGLRFVDELRQAGRTSRVPVILLVHESRRRDSGMLSRAFEVDTLEKPFASEALIEKVEQLLGAGDGRAACPVCEDSVDEAAVTCPACASAHHPECWQLNDGCGRCTPLE